MGVGEVEGAGEEAEWMPAEEKKPVPYGWFVVIILLIGGLAGMSAMLILRTESSDVKVAREAADERIEENEEEEAEAVALVESIEETLSHYLAAESLAELAPLVRDHERVKPLMVDWYSRHAMEPRKFEGLGVFQPLDLEGRLFWLVSCMIEGGDSETILVEQTEDGQVFVDWETQVCYQPMEWNDFVKKRPEGESIDFRVYAQWDWAGFYSHEFSDEEKWSVYRLWTLGSEEYLFGYAPKGSELDKELIHLIRTNRGRPVALHLGLRIPEGSTSPRGVLIEKVISGRWATVSPLTEQ
ncbi:hypothetical protein ACFQY0_04890 [Haloferula chungangensis]|uniref:Uncharacterized protein n=1 Tax=Haloferula chungangensis TaxID=1048331 RepID=A0ABW2L4L9_9BACT